MGYIKAYEKRASEWMPLLTIPEFTNSAVRMCYNHRMLVNAKPIIDKLEELRDKRNCRCSAYKIAERAYFDIVITDVRLMVDSEGNIDTDKVVYELEKTRLSTRASRRELQIRYNVYEYAIRIIRMAERTSE